MFVKNSVFVTDKRKALACGEIWTFFVNYESVKFYRTGPWAPFGATLKQASEHFEIVL